MPSKEISNKTWLYDIFVKDPTIKSMLIMLDAIHNLFEIEFSKNNSLILFPSISNLTFYILPLNGFDLRDDLYIKMNARGKQLTDFENFKADLTNWLKSDYNPLKKEFQEHVNYDGRSIPFYLHFITPNNLFFRMLRNINILMIHLTFDFLQEILSLGSSVKVIEPQSLIDKIKTMHLDSLKRYE